MHTIKIIVDQVSPLASCTINGVKLSLFAQPQQWLELADTLIHRAMNEAWTVHVSAVFAEFLVLRLLRRVREGIFPHDKLILAVMHIPQHPTLLMEVTEDGDIATPWPGGFFATRADELF
jgi:hypothetical protein